MTHLDLARPEQRRQKASPRLTPVGLLNAVVRKKRSRAEAVRNQGALTQAWIEAILLDEDCNRAALKELASLKFSTVVAAVFPPTSAALKRHATERSRAIKDAENRVANVINWASVMPNGKPLHQCTFQYVAGVNAGLATIAALGKGRMQRRIGEVFRSAAALEAAVRGADHA